MGIPLRSYLVSLLLPAILLAGEAERTSLAGEYRAGNLTELDQVALVVIAFSEKHGEKYHETVAMVTASPWIARLKELLTKAEGARGEHCFCVSYPRAELLDRNGKLASLSPAHATGLHYYGRTISGVYRVGEATAGAVLDLLLSQRESAIPVPKRSPPASKPALPGKVEIKFSD